MSEKTEAMVDFVFRRLQQQIDQSDEKIRTLTMRTEQAMVAQGVPARTLANAPALAGTATDGVSICFISNGRKSGEGVGAGTGVLAYFNPTTATWFRCADDTAVVI